jgi:hypothetical protein
MPKTSTEQEYYDDADEEEKLSSLPVAPNENPDFDAAQKAAQLKETIRAGFQAFDTNGSGKIDANELQYLVTSLGGVLSNDDLQEALKLLDKDKSGSIDFVRYRCGEKQRKFSLQRSTSPNTLYHSVR